MQLNDYYVPQKEFDVSIQTFYESEDLSGETSSTEYAHKGIKPKDVSVSFIVPFSEESLMSEFYSIAEALDDNGDLLIYDITDRTANSANIRQVRFSGNIDQFEMKKQNAWRVRFRLKEVLSVAEKMEQRQVADETVSFDASRLQSIVEKSKQALA